MQQTAINQLRRLWHLATVGVPAQCRTWRARRLRGQHAEAIASLPAVRAADHPRLEVHMLCGHRQVDMGIWASWSAMRFLPQGRLCVHDDGSLTEEDREQWAARVARHAIYWAEGCGWQVTAQLRTSCPLLCEWRNVHLLALKLVDAHLLAEAPNVLVMDSDVLCFQVPVAVHVHVADESAGYLWMQDMTYAYLNVPGVLHEAIGAPVPLMVNSGFWVGPRADERDFQKMEWVLQQWRDDGRCDWRTCGRSRRWWLSGRRSRWAGRRCRKPMH